MSYFATDLSHEFGVVFGFDVLGVIWLDWLLLVVIGCFVMRFFSEALFAFSPLVSNDSTVAALTVEFSFCLPVLSWLGVG